MKIVVIRDTRLFGVNSASTNRTLGLIKGLRALNVDVESIFLGVSPKELNQDIINTYGNVIFTTVPFKISGRLAFFNNYLYPGLFTSYFARIILKKGYPKNTIYWIQDSLLSFKVGECLKDMDLKKTLFLEMSEFPDFYKEHNLSFRIRILKDWKFKEYENKVKPLLDGIALMTNTLIENFENSHDILTLHLPMTVDFERFSQKPELINDDKETYLAYVGLLGNHKDGIDVLLKAFKGISEEYPNVKLKIAGPRHEDSPKHDMLLRSLDLIDRVQFIGELDKSEVPAFLIKAKVLLLPRPASRQAQGGFPTKLGEYLATGRPVCATTVGEIPDYLTDDESVFFAEPGSVNSFAGAMKRALSNSEHARKVGINGRKVAEKDFNAQIQAEKLKKFFEQLLESRSK